MIDVRYFLGVLLCLGSLTFGQAAWSNAQPCIPVAKLVPPEGSQAASIRVDRARLSSTENLSAMMELCEDDSVSWPEGVTVGIIYYESPPAYLEFPGPHEIRIKGIPENTKIDNLLHTLKRWLLPDSVAAVKRGAVRGFQSLTSPLAHGEYKESPFYLLTDAINTHFFWEGGQPPWNLQIVDSNGRIVVDESLSAPQGTFSLPEPADGSSYMLKVFSADGLTLHKPLVFESPMRHGISDPTPPWSKIILLLGQDVDKNWRLYIWNTVRSFPDGPAKASIMKHLEEDDI